MTIFIIFSSQKTRGRVAGNLGRLHATHIARIVLRMASRTAFCCAHLFMRGLFT